MERRLEMEMGFDDEASDFRDERADGESEMEISEMEMEMKLWRWRWRWVLIKKGDLVPFWVFSAYTRNRDRS
ncbi:hypothetical protein SO802_007573, partial [Lithocarpus litseifolius]